MTVHTIMLPDRMRGREPRSVIWDDEAGTVTGQHSRVPWMQELLARPTPLDASSEGMVLFLQDPAHDPRDFLHILAGSYWPILHEDRHRLPTALREVEPTRPDSPPGAVLDENGLVLGMGHYDEDGRPVVTGVF